MVTQRSKTVKLLPLSHVWSVRRHTTLLTMSRPYHSVINRKSDTGRVSVPAWFEWTVRITGWAAWQLVVLAFVFLVYASLFSEYGSLDTPPVVDSIAALAFLLFAVFLGTLPARRWFAQRRG